MHKPPRHSSSKIRYRSPCTCIGPAALVCWCRPPWPPTRRPCWPSSAKPAKWLQRFPALARSITHAETSPSPPAGRYGRPRNCRAPAPPPDSTFRKSEQASDLNRSTDGDISPGGVADRSGRNAPYFANHARCLSCAAIHDNRTSVAGGRDCGRRKPPSLNHSIGMGWRRQERRVVVWRPDSRQIKVHHNGTYRFGSFLAWSDSKVVAVTNAEGDVRSELSSL